MSLELALEWASQGIRVLPVNGKTKRPLIKAWQDAASTVQTEIHAWWFHYPDARVGLATGAPGPDVLDFDVAGGKPGMEQLERLLDAGVLEPGTFRLVSTPSGGRHVYLRGSEQRNKQNERAIPGVDFRGAGGMVLAPGNPGYRYIAGELLDLADLKPVDWAAIELCLALDRGGERTTPTTLPKPASVPTPALVRVTTRLVSPLPGYDNARGEESPLDWFCANNDLTQLLAADGWQFAYEHQDRQYWVRPGKEAKEGVSGNVWVNPDGRQTFVNFSTSVDLPTDRGMSAAQYWAYTRFRGDTRAAASEVRRTLMPRHERPQTIALEAPPVTQTGLAGMDAPPGAGGATEGTPGAELVPVSEVGPPEMVVGFWERRHELGQIRQLARERGVSPWATLGAVLAMVTCRVGPHVVLPPIVGGVASLNLLVGLVGPSGKGKGAAWAVAEEYLDARGKFPMEEVGTSQGIDSCFTETSPKAGSIQFNDVAFFYVPEIDTMKAHSEMSGSALLPHLRKIWSGEALGARYAKQENRRPVRAHAYRASVVAGIQPARSGVLLADVDGGTPQRWLWLPVFDPDAINPKARLQPPRYVGKPPAIDYDVWVPAGEQRGEKNEPVAVEMKSRYELQVCQQAQDEIRLARYENLRTEYGSMDSHSLLTRLKVAAALAFLDRRSEVTVEDWELTLPLMWISNDTRAKCMQAVADVEQEEHRRRGRGRAHQDLAADVTRVQLKDARVERIQELGGKLLGAMQAEPGKEWSPKELRELMGDARARKEFWSEVEQALVAAPGVVQGPEISSGGRKIRKLTWRSDHILLPPSEESR